MCAPCVRRCSPTRGRAASRRRIRSSPSTPSVKRFPTVEDVATDPTLPTPHSSSPRRRPPGLPGAAVRPRCARPDGRAVRVTKDAPAGTAAWCAGAAPQRAGGVRLLNASVLTSATRADRARGCAQLAPTRPSAPSPSSTAPRGGGGGRRHSGAAPPPEPPAPPPSPSPPLSPLPPGAPLLVGWRVWTPGPTVPFRIEYDNDYADVRRAEQRVRRGAHSHPAQRRPG